MGQKSAPCTSGPCVEIGREDDLHSGISFAGDKDHFIYCAEGSAVTIDIYAKFRSGTQCGDCSHGPRTWEWSVSGGTSGTVDSIQVISSLKQVATVTLGEAGDSITITCEVGSASEEECEEGQHGTDEHGGSHAGASQSCTIKLWRLDMEVSAPSGDVDPNTPSSNNYTTTFADSITTKGVLVGASAIAATGGNHPWSWESNVDGSPFATMVDSSTWTGEMVATSEIEVVAKVINACYPSLTKTASKSVVISPQLRRSGWRMSLGSSIGTDTNWLSTDPTGFPGYSNGGGYGQNNNTTSKYQVIPEQVITPIYEDLSITHSAEYKPVDWPGGVPNDFGSFSSVAAEILGGPNVGLFYNGSTAIYQIGRVAQINHWTTPSATLPGIAPALDPFGNAYSNWAAIYGSGPQNCGCSNPSAHGGAGINNIRNATNIYHELTGSPGSSNQDKLGHYALIRDAVNGPNPTYYDVLWNIDLEYATSEGALLIKDESKRYTISNRLLAESATLHSFVNATPQRHNFHGVIYFADEGTQTWNSPITDTY